MSQFQKITPSVAISKNSTTTSPNPTYQIWVQQDKLIFSALVRFLSTPIISLISMTKVSPQAWTILANNTYAKPTQGHIKQNKK